MKSEQLFFKNKRVDTNQSILIPNENSISEINNRSQQGDNGEGPFLNAVDREDVASAIINEHTVVSEVIKQRQEIAEIVAKFMENTLNNKRSFKKINDALELIGDQKDPEYSGLTIASLGLVGVVALIGIYYLVCNNREISDTISKLETNYKDIMKEVNDLKNHPKPEVFLENNSEDVGKVIRKTQTECAATYVGLTGAWVIMKKILNRK